MQRLQKLPAEGEYKHKFIPLQNTRKIISKLQYKIAVNITKYFIEGSIFEAHSIARWHRSSRCDTAIRYKKSINTNTMT